MLTKSKKLQLVLLGFILIAFSNHVYAQNAENIIDKFINKWQSTAIRTDFNISVTQPQTQSLNYSGQIIIKGNQFCLTSAGMEMHFDGTTLWMYDQDLDEINISEPSDDELIDVNPILLAQILRKNCWIRFTDNFKDNTIWSIDLYPQNKKSEITKYTIQIRKTDLIPNKIIVQEIHSKQTTVILSGQKTGVDTTNKFTLDTNKYSSATINDLR